MRTDDTIKRLKEHIDEAFESTRNEVHELKARVSALRDSNEGLRLTNEKLTGAMRKLQFERNASVARFQTAEREIERLQAELAAQVEAAPTVLSNGSEPYLLKFKERNWVPQDTFQRAVETEKERVEENRRLQAELAERRNETLVAKAGQIIVPVSEIHRLQEELETAEELLRTCAETVDKRESFGSEEFVVPIYKFLNRHDGDKDGKDNT